MQLSTRISSITPQHFNHGAEKVSQPVEGGEYNPELDLEHLLIPGNAETTRNMEQIQPL